ncbi:MAG TPA: sigma-70 family RNA polymerase sigma factor [Rhizomicrobium sp.]|nr:sigma-70 family RNA polymerase sigma factor [Rhizomicrobium sp.]
MNIQTHATAAMPPAIIAADFQRDLVALIPFLRAFSRTLCGNRALAEDMAQEALVKAWRARARFEPGTNLKGWLFTILRNEFYSHTRSAWRETHWDADLGERIPSAGREQESIMELSDTARALRSLPDGQREALILVAAGGFSYEDAGEICSTPVGTVKSRVARARAALSKILDNNQPAPLPARVANASHDILAQLSALTPPGAQSAGTHA